MLGELEDANEADDAKECERRARFRAGATHRGQHVEQCHVVRHDRHYVDNVLEVAPEPELRRTRDETHDHFDGEPGRAVPRTRTRTADGQRLGKSSRSRPTRSDV